MKVFIAIFACIALAAGDPWKDIATQGNGKRAGAFKKMCPEVELDDATIDANLDAHLNAPIPIAVDDNSKFGINCMSGYSKEQFKANFLNARPSAEAESSTRPSHALKQTRVAAPASVDWRTKGYVSSVKNQGNCGSCWTFSACGAIEGALYKKTGVLSDCAEQNFVDCVSTSTSNGCNGGWMTDAYDYVKKNAGVNKNSSYPYLAKQQTSCKYAATGNIGTITSYAYTIQNNDTDLVNTLATVGPVAVAIQADEIQNYVSGVYTCKNYTGINHGVLAVGYGTDSTVSPPQDYWIIKNSWGPNWGENGYVRLRRNQGTAAGCGVNGYANYVVA